MKTGMGRAAAMFQGNRLHNPVKRFRLGLILLAVVLVSGTIGYVILGSSVGDAVYQTVITVSTVGYGEFGAVTVPYRIFTVVLILSGTGTVLYTLGVLIEAIFEGRIDSQLRRRRMQAAIDRLKGHVVICGFGQVGRTIYTELNKKGLQVVIIDQHDFYDDYKHHDYGIRYWVSGEATEDRSLLQAGVERAGTLVLALKSDVDNLYVALTARSMNAALCIVSSVHEWSVVPKLRQAGADHVVNPYEIGGSRMAEWVLSSSSDKGEEDRRVPKADVSEFTGLRRRRTQWIRVLLGWFQAERHLNSEAKAREQ